MKKKIKIIKNKFGNIQKLFQRKDILKIKEIYISEIFYKKKKGWNYHKKSTSQILVIQGKIKFYITKNFKNINTITINCDDSKFLVIKPKNWFSFEGLSKKNKLINFSDMKHDKKETKKKPIH